MGIAAVLCVCSARGQFDIPWYTIAGGGGSGTDGTLQIDGTIGQSVTDGASGNGISVQAGFWNEATLDLAPVLREFPVQWVTVGASLDVTLHVNPPPDRPSYTIEEQVPAGWQVGAVSDGGVVAGVRITWTFADRRSRNLRYRLSPVAPGGELVFGGRGVFAGAPASTQGPFVLPVLPHVLEAREVAGNLHVYGQDSDSNRDILTIEPGGAINQFKVTFRTSTQTNVTSVANVTGRILVYGQRGDDDIRVSDSIARNAELHGGPGNDTLKGGAGNDLLLGEDGNDFILSSPGFDTFEGGPGQDGVVFYGTPGDDDIHVRWYLIDRDLDPQVVVHPPFPKHADGLRVFVNDEVHDMNYTPQDDFETIVVYAGAGNDRVEMADDASAQHWNAEFHGEEGDDVLIGARNLSDKHRGNDVLVGGPGNDLLMGNSGNDLLDGGPGEDRIEGGIAINHIVTDGLDQLTLNSNDELDLRLDRPDARTATIDWGDGTEEAALVDIPKGLVSGRHSYRRKAGGPLVIRVTSLDASGTPHVDLIQPSFVPGPLTDTPGPLALEFPSPSRLQVTFAAVPGSTYVVESTQELAGAPWEVLGETLCELDGFVRFEVADWLQEAARFFRARAMASGDEELVVLLPATVVERFELEAADEFADLWQSTGAPELGGDGILRALNTLAPQVRGRLYRIPPGVLDRLQRQLKDPICGPNFQGIQGVRSQ